MAINIPLVLVFEYDLTHPPNKSTIPLSPPFASCALYDIPMYSNSSMSYEPIQPLLKGLRLAFLNDSASSNHGNVRPNTIFITPSGEWNNPEGDLSVIYTMGGLMPDAMACTPQKSKSVPISAADRYTFSLLIHAVFNPTHPPPPTAQLPHPFQVFCRGAIPTSVLPFFKKLLNSNPKSRMSPKYLLDIGMAESDGEGHEFFVNNQLIKVWAGLDGFTLMTRMCSTLKESGSSFPPEFVSYRVLPYLASALEFGGVSAANHRAPDDYGLIIVAPLAKLFASADRGTRIVLLDSLPDFTEKLDKETVVNKIWPSPQTGFTDTVTVIREAIVCAIVLHSPKLSDRILNNDRLHTEASIRTNMCILIGRLGPSLEYNTKRKVLVPAFSMALRDSFVHACVAGVMAFMATAECFGMEGVAGKVVSAVVSVTLDKEKLVRDQAFKAVELFVKRLEAHAATMPETASTEEDGEDLPARLRGAFTQASLVSSATDAASALTGCTAQLAPADMQMTISITIDGSPLAPNLNGRAGPLPLSSASPFVNPSRSKGLQLSGNKAPTSTLTAQLANEAGQGSNHLTHALPTTRRSIAPSTLAPAFSPASSARSTPVSSPRPLPNAADNALSTSMAGMSKEEKAAEMARRKEERRLGIEKLKNRKRTLLLLERFEYDGVDGQLCLCDGDIIIKLCIFAATP
ncbi:hypothetical protein EDB19DRAFT_1900024 [Suillus lakei]|nr:hypothetical protein EDB19DRAFT_1900024 [Suillus lakei]